MSVLVVYYGLVRAHYAQHVLCEINTIATFGHYLDLSGAIREGFKVEQNTQIIRVHREISNEISAQQEIVATARRFLLVRVTQFRI